MKTGWIVTNEDGVFSYLPLAHGYECAVEMALLIRGARISYYSGSLRNLVDDLQAARPTLFIAVPRVLQRIQQTILNSFASQSSGVSGTRRSPSAVAAASRCTTASSSTRCESFLAGS